MNTSPARVAAALRYVVDKIENSDKPSKTAVAADLEVIRSALEGRESRIAGSPEMMKILWEKPAGKAVQFDWDRAKDLTDEDKLVFQLQKLQRDLGQFVDAIEGKEKKDGGQDQGVFTSAPKIR